MQISDMLGEYNRNVSAKPENLNGMKGVQQLVSSLKGLTVGNIFEGTVNSIKNGQVTLGLSNGQVITAKMDGKVSLSAGQSMFFQVKSNDGIQIAIRPYTGMGNIENPTLVTALTAAGLPVNEKNLVMVNTMMQEQMSIDKSSLNEMVKTMLANETIDSKTIVQMVKAGIPVNETMAAQFENYKMDEHAIVKELNTIMDEMPELLKNGDFSAKQLVELNHMMTGGVLEGNSGQMASQSTMPGNEQTASQNAVSEPVVIEIGQESKANYPEGTVGSLLDGTQAAALTKQLSQIPELAVNANLFQQGVEGEEIVDHLNLKMPVSDFLKEVDVTLQKAVENGTLGNKNLIGDTAVLQDLKRLFAGKEYRTLLKNGLEQEWLLKPNDLKTEHKVEELYQRLNTQMEHIENTLKEMGLAKTSVMETITDVRNNMEFMNQLNQAYTYVQIPLKMSGQQANAELYVYTNKKRLVEPEGELTAFLHLELKNLGATDVSVKMHPATKQVKTNFYLQDDGAYDLIERNLPVLEQRLKKKGYQCEIIVTNESKKVSFVEDFLKKDQKAAGTVHRYSFDVRA
ncbi:MAG: flagellar hook-length control protein FliK [Roseburia sp.]